MATDWNSVQTSVKQVIRDRGQWIGLLNEDWEPIAELEPTLFQETDTRLAAPEVSLTLPGRDSGSRVSLAVDELVAEDLGVFDERGYFRAKNDVARSICVAREGYRQAFFIPYLDAEGQRAPESLTVEAAGLLSLLEAWPCPSIPESWRGQWSTETGDAGVEKYDRERELSLVEMATRADGYTVNGPAEPTIQNLIQDSLDAVNSHMGWTADPHMVVDMASTGRTSPEVMIRVEDDLVLPTVDESARLAGVNISVDLWWPGDETVLVRDSDRKNVSKKEFPHPVAVVRVQQIEEV